MWLMSMNNSSPFFESININLKKSNSSYLFNNLDGKRYLDLISMYSSMPLGYNHQIFDKKFQEEVNAVSHLKMCNGLYTTDEFLLFKKEFIKILPKNIRNIHFSSTGSLAVESAIKCAFSKKSNQNSKVLILRNSFHGIGTWGFFTDKEIGSVKKRIEFCKDSEWVSFLEPEEIIQAINNSDQNIAAVLIEPIQCTSGDTYISPKDLKEINLLCKKKDICFIIDEIQTGFGTTGEMWISARYKLDPDIIIFGKKAQISGIATNDYFSDAIKSPSRILNVTFDGDLIDAIRSKYIIQAINQFSLLENVKTKSELLKAELSNFFPTYRSIGFIIALDFENQRKRDNFVSNCLKDLVLVNPTGSHTVRIRPNLAFNDSELDKLVNIFKKNS